MFPHTYAVVAFLVGLGGLLGANLRYALGVVAGDALVVTLLVNAVGSFGLGLLFFASRAEIALPERVRYFLATGCLASFTTYSTFIADIALTSPVPGLVYIGGSYAAGIVGVVLGRSIMIYRPWQFARPGDR